MPKRSSILLPIEVMSILANESGIHIVTLAASENFFLVIFLAKCLPQKSLNIWQVLLEVFIADLGWVIYITDHNFDFSSGLGHVLRDLCFFIILSVILVFILLLEFSSGFFQRFHLSFGFWYQLSWLFFQIHFPLPLGRRSQLWLWPRLLFSIV